MNKKKENTSPDGSSEKTCFIIMPISDHQEYSSGHFGRVYEYIIKPACDLAGFTAIRADDVKTTNYIALDIIKQIIKSDMAICDLSSQNPNVLYEVGIRQAFNLPVTFIKDNKTKRIFDIQGFRDVPYDENLRIDAVQKAVIDLSEVLINTYENREEVNSLVSLLGIEPAKISQTEITADTELILNAIKGIEYRVARTEQLYQAKNENLSNISSPAIYSKIVIPANAKKLEISDISKLNIGDSLVHEKFGNGKIAEIVPREQDGAVLTIDFDFVGKKMLLAKLAKLWWLPKEK